jgi:hypothetical protein
VTVLAVLRALTLVARLTFAAMAILVARRTRHGAPKPLHVAWSLVAGVFALVAASTFLLESLALAATVSPGHAGWLDAVRVAIYNELYLLVGMALAGLAALLLVTLVQQPWARRAGAVLAVVVVGTAAYGFAGGGASDWAAMLSVTRILSFEGIAGYLTFCAIFLLGQMPLVDRWLAAIIITETVFELLIPVPEVFFQAVGQADAAAIWPLLQLMQLAAAAVQVAFVWGAYRALRRGGPSELLRQSYALG